MGGHEGGGGETSRHGDTEPDVVEELFGDMIKKPEERVFKERQVPQDRLVARRERRAPPDDESAEKAKIAGGGPVRGASERLARLDDKSDKYNTGWASGEVVEGSAGLKGMGSYEIIGRNVNLRDPEKGFKTGQIQERGVGVVIAITGERPAKMVNGVTFVPVEHDGGRIDYIAAHYLKPIRGRVTTAEKSKDKVELGYVQSLRDTVMWKAENTGRSFDEVWPKFEEAYTALEAGSTNSDVPLADAYKKVFGGDIRADRIAMELDIQASQKGARVQVEVTTSGGVDNIGGLDGVLSGLALEVSTYYGRDPAKPMTPRDIRDGFGLGADLLTKWGQKGSRVTFDYKDGSLHFLPPEGENGAEKVAREIVYPPINEAMLAIRRKIQMGAGRRLA